MHNVRCGEVLCRVGRATLPGGIEYPSVQKGTGIMVKQVKISNFTEVKNIMNAASGCANDVGVHDSKGSIADAKSILGLMSLDYTHPVLLVSEDAQALEQVCKAIN